MQGERRLFGRSAGEEMRARSAVLLTSFLIIVIFNPNAAFAAYISKQTKER